MARARPDGYTLMVSGSTTYSVLPALKTDLPYDPLRSYEHIAIVSLAPLALLARRTCPPARPAKRPNWPASRAARAN